MRLLVGLKCWLDRVRLFQLDMQRALRQEVASVCHVLERSECKRCTKHRRHRAAPDITHAPDLTFRERLAYHCSSVDSQLITLATVPFWSTKQPLTHGKCLVCDDMDGLVLH